MKSTVLAVIFSLFAGASQAAPLVGTIGVDFQDLLTGTMGGVLTWDPAEMTAIGSITFLRDGEQTSRTELSDLGPLINQLTVDLNFAPAADAPVSSDPPVQVGFDVNYLGFHQGTAHSVLTWDPSRVQTTGEFGLETAAGNALFLGLGSGFSVDTIDIDLGFQPAAPVDAEVPEPLALILVGSAIALIVRIYDRQKRNS